jgi:hypothetical protein
MRSLISSQICSNTRCRRIGPSVGEASGDGSSLMGRAGERRAVLAGMFVKAASVGFAMSVLTE